MITIAKVDGQVETQVSELYGLNKDVVNLPTEYVPNASIFYAMDTFEVYMFDAENKVWIKQE